MLRKTLILISILFLNLTYSQNLDKLDIKNGFRDFILGSSPNDIKNLNLKGENSNFPNVINYNYTGNDLKEIFGVNVESIDLSFFNNKLFSIRIDFGNYDNSFENSEFYKIQALLEQAYGDDWYNATDNDGKIINGSIWNAKNVKLELIRIDFSKSKTNPQDYGYISGYIQVIDKKLMQKIYNNSF